MKELIHERENRVNNEFSGNDSSRLQIWAKIKTVLELASIFDFVYFIPKKSGKNL